ncbi:FliM/FliN family flagellar motor C-terminal domain-containing protein [Ruegeria atlantica]|uniref:FliM/FliN family flagellar motor C-terminal domain-containing protein n=1 Tax=Ruegeria atlantica TaxID=81569 RepID=UPI00147B90F4|nr:FliM/FliN family flagellar motor C-terminal domain-containing protein [Ruegeria atlantica]
MTQSGSTALARKLSVGQEERDDRSRSALRALRLAFARAAGDKLQLPLTVIGAKQSVRATEALIDRIGDDWLILQFVNGNGVVAAACMDMGAASAIVQVQTIGEVLSDTPASRPYTHTDGAMIAPLVEDALMRAVELVDTPADQSSLSGYEYSFRLDDLRAMSLALVEDMYRVFELTVELGGGLRQGRISVFLPELPNAEEDATTDESTGPVLEKASGVLRAELDTVICRMTLPLASLSDLGVGDILPLTGSRLDRTEVLTIDRRRAAIGRLGQCGGMRAVRLNEYAPLSALTQPGAEDFREARTTKPLQRGLDMPLQTDIPQAPDSLESVASSDAALNLNFADSNQIAAEISELAGLAYPGHEPDSLG